MRDDPIDWNAFPFSVAAIGSLRAIDVRSRVLCFAGENGSGKSTLLEAVALSCGFGREGGTRNIRFATQDQPDKSPDAPVERLADALRLTWTKRQRDGFFLRAESFFNVATYLDRLERETTMGPRPLASYGGISLHARSHGESFFTLFLQRFAGKGLYLLDEPEAALSAARQLALMARMHDLLQSDAESQFLIATHSPILLGFPGAQICSFDGGRIAEIAYRDTDAYVLTRRFLESPDRMLRELFAESGDSE
jgi:predicted ATPase